VQVETCDDSAGPTEELRGALAGEGLNFLLKRYAFSLVNPSIESQKPIAVRVIFSEFEDTT